MMAGWQLFTAHSGLLQVSVCDLLCENGNLFFSRGRDMSQRLNVAMNGKENVEYSLLPEGMGYHFEAIEV